MRVVVTPEADGDLQDHIGYIAARDPDAAERVRAAIIGGMRQLADFPRVGRPGRVEGTRELAIAGTPYVGIYEVLADVVAIVHIIHGRQQWPREQ